MKDMRGSITALQQAFHEDVKTLMDRDAGMAARIHLLEAARTNSAPAPR
jgi:hypothetical protein